MSSSPTQTITGTDKIFSCPAGQRILTRTRTQPRREHAAADGAIDWEAPNPGLPAGTNHRDDPAAAPVAASAPSTPDQASGVGPLPPPTPEAHPARPRTSTMPTYYRSAALMAYPDGRLLRYTTSRLEVWTGHGWDRAGSSIPTDATPITENAAATITGQAGGEGSR